MGIGQEQRLRKIRTDKTVRIFNEETNGKECVILATFDEIKILHEMIDAAVTAHPKKSTWKKLRNMMELLAVY